MKKTFLSSLIFILLISSVSVASALETLPSAGYNDPLLDDYSQYQNPFSDTYILMWEGKAAAELYRRKITSGYPDGEFKGHREINRAEAVKFLLQARYDQIPETTATDSFADVNDTHWFKNYVLLAKEKEIISGYADNSFQAGKSINTAEFLKMFAKTFELPDNLPHSYIDVDAQGWYAPLAGIAAVYNLFPERENKLEPGRNLTRTEVAIALYNYFKNRNVEIDLTIDKNKYKNVEAEAYSRHKYGSVEGKVAIDIVGNLSNQDAKDSFATLLELQATYPDDVRIIWNYYPKSIYDYKEYEAGNSAECADEQEKFWEYFLELIKQEPSAYSRALYLNIASSLDLNMKKFELCIEDETYLGRIQHDKEQGLKDKLEVIPTLTINGTMYTEKLNLAELSDIVETILTPTT